MIQPGTVVLMDVPGAVQKKIRPAVVVSTDLYHRTRPDVVAAIITTNLSAATLPTDYLLQDWAAAGLRKPSAFRAYLNSSPRKRILSEIGQLSDKDWKAVQTRLRLALAV